jgi:hypothetical protein
VISGIHARGGTALKALNKGVNKAFAFLFQPIRIPNAIPNVQSMAKAANTLTRLAQT